MRGICFLFGTLVLSTVILSGLALTTAERNALTSLRTTYPVLTSNAMAFPWTGNVASACDNNWSGIACYEDHIVYLGLAGLGLTGSFPSEIVTAFTYLEVLELEKNQLSGGLPTDWSDLQSLSTLNLWSNKLSGNFPTSIWALPEITHVDIYDNSFTGTLPNSIGEATELTYLGLDSNKFSGPIPSSISNLKQLVELWLCNNTLSGNVPDVWSDMGQLKWLRLDRNNLTVCSVTSLPPFITASNCNITVQATPSCGSGCDAVWSRCTRSTIPASCSSPPPPETPPVVPPVAPPISPPVAPPETHPIPQPLATTPSPEASSPTPVLESPLPVESPSIQPNPPVFVPITSPQVETPSSAPTVEHSPVESPAPSSSPVQQTTPTLSPVDAVLPPSAASRLIYSFGIVFMSLAIMAL